MVTGLDKFISHFKSFEAHYVLIGGAACDWFFEEQGFAFRATKDLDIVLITEAISDDFVRHFWEFIRLGEYQKAERGEKQQFYRFRQPQNVGFPKMIELFSRVPDGIDLAEDVHLTPIPTGEDISSLSAILLDDDYYDFLRVNNVAKDGLRSANDIALIALKAKAWLNNLALQAAGHPIQTGDVKKHLNDVLRLSTLASSQKGAPVATTIQNDMKQFVEMARRENPDVKPLLKPHSISSTSLEDLLNIVETLFALRNT